MVKHTCSSNWCKVLLPEQKLCSLLGLFLGPSQTIQSIKTTVRNKKTNQTQTLLNFKELKSETKTNKQTVDYLTYVADIAACPSKSITTSFFWA